MDNYLLSKPARLDWAKVILSISTGGLPKLYLTISKYEKDFAFRTIHQ